MNYALGYAFSAKDLFYNFNTTKLKLNKKSGLDIRLDRDKKNLAAKIFAKSAELIIKDIIDNNTHFKLPGNCDAYLFMKRTEGEQFKKAFRRGKWRDVDFIQSNFSGYQIFLEMRSNKRLPRQKPIYVSSQLKQQIIDNTNLGKQY